MLALYCRLSFRIPDVGFPEQFVSFKGMPMKMDGVNVIAGVAHAKPIAFFLASSETRLALADRPLLRVAYPQRRIEKPLAKIAVAWTKPITMLPYLSAPVPPDQKLKR